MKPTISNISKLVVPAILCTLLALFALQAAVTPTSPSQPSAAEQKLYQERNAWVAQCLKDFQSIKKGMTRAEVETRFKMDGGLHGVSPIRFVHPSCDMFKINVDFDFKRDANNQNGAVSGKDDKVSGVSKPYIELGFAD